MICFFLARFSHLGIKYTAKPKTLMERTMSKINGKISIIMPAYNEEAHIYENILETRNVFEEEHEDFEIIIVDDGSSDRTYQNSQKAADEFPDVMVVKQPHNMGKGWALRKGFEKATGNYVVFLDSDLDLHPRQIHLLFDIMDKNQADVVIGSKRHPDSRLNYPKDRKIISSGYFFLVKMMFGLPLRDTQTGLKLFKYEVLENVFPKICVKRYAFDLEVLVVAHHKGYKIAESPIVLEHHWKFGRIGLKAIWDTWKETLAVYYRLKILKYYDRTNE